MSNHVKLAATTSPQSLFHFQSSQVLNRQAAKSRLQTLPPDTEEHSKLQNALIRTAGIVEISLPTAVYRVDTSSEDCVLLGGFGASEHVAIGEEVKLQGLPANTPLIVKGGSRIQFQHIIALAGDFYGVAGQAISLPGGTDTEKTKRFTNAFETLVQADNTELRKVLLEIDNECSAVKHSSLPHHCYSSCLIESNHALEKIKSDINKLLIDNSDHFSTNAEEAYRIGHMHALRVAREAGNQKDMEGLKRAYALDAFACHFLTDLFASGHTRNQRGALESFLVEQLKFDIVDPKKLAGLLTFAQHEKDGKDGLNVANKKGEHWRAYGDGCFFTPQNGENKKKATAATQQSVDEIYRAYAHATEDFFIPVDDPEYPYETTVDQLIPHATPYNPLPLYSIEGNSLFLYRGSDKIEITSKNAYLDCLNKITSQALRYLPEDYISGFIIPRIELHPVVEKAILPLIERVTGPIWQIVGIATYYQVRQGTQQLNQKIDEMADVLSATYKNSEEILRQIQDLHIKVDRVLWESLFREILDPIALIKDKVHQREIHKEVALNDSELQKAEIELSAAHIRMSRVFGKGAADGRNMVKEYAEMLAKSQPSMPLKEIKISVTLWFRQMLDYQVQAVALRTAFRIMRKQEDELQKSVSIFEADLVKQVEINEDHIDKTLIFESHSYIALQLEKSRTKRLAFNFLNPSP